MTYPEAGMLPSRTWIAFAVAAVLTGISLGLMHLRDAVPNAFMNLTPTSLSSDNRSLVEFLLLLPIAATLVCFVRIVIGLNTFGTFAPALLGIAFREVDSPIGLFVLLTILFAGWFLRHAVNHLYLLQVPRTSLMLSLVVSMLVLFVLLAPHLQLTTGKALPMIPLVILTGMIERFWTIDEEQGTRATFITLLTTLSVCVGISLVLRWSVIIDQMLHYPETILCIMSIQILLGRYTGYRITELYRFRCMLKEDPCTGYFPVGDSGNSESWA